MQHTSMHSFVTSRNDVDNMKQPTQTLTTQIQRKRHMCHMQRNATHRTQHTLRPIRSRMSPARSILMHIHMPMHMFTDMSDTHIAANPLVRIAGVLDDLDNTPANTMHLYMHVCVHVYIHVYTHAMTRNKTAEHLAERVDASQQT